MRASRHTRRHGRSHTHIAELTLHGVRRILDQAPSTRLDGSRLVNVAVGGVSDLYRTGGGRACGIILDSLTRMGHSRASTTEVPCVARTWLSIQVDLVEGHGKHLWPRPGRILVAARSHTFAQLADAIDDAFGRWDRAHLHEFELTNGTRLTTPYEDWQELGPAIDDRRARLGLLSLGERFVYVFDFGDDWAHLCTVGPQRVDPLEAVGIIPDEPLPYFGWGTIPDQYGRRWDSDDGESRRPRDPGLADLPPLRPLWGPPERWRHGRLESR